MEQNEKYIWMTTAPVGRLIGKLAVPTVITMLITSIYNMADTYFVGLLDNTSATGAVGVVFSFMAIIQACGFLFGQGSGNFISRALGQQRREDASRMASFAFFASVAAGCAISLLGMIFLEPLARLLGSTDTILPYAKDYLRIILLGAPYMTGALTLNNQLRFQGAAYYSMIGIGSGGLLNIALDPLFIFGFDMGVTGAAVATIISQAVSFLLLLYGTTRGENLRLSVRRARPQKGDVAELFRGGFPSLCRQGLSSVSTISLNWIAGTFGQDPAIAAMGISARIMHMAFAAILGFGQGFQPVCGFNYGAGLYKRVKEAFWFCVKLGTALLLVASVAGLIFAPVLVSLFSSDDAVIAIGTVALRLQCFSFPLTAWFVMCTMLTQTIGRVVPASFLSLARQGLFFIPLVIGVPYFIAWAIPAADPILGVQMAQPLADMMTAAVSVPVCIHVMRNYLAKDENKS